MAYYRFSLLVLLFWLLSVIAQTCRADEAPETTATWGQFVDPDGDCSFRITDGVLTLRFGAGSHVLDIETNPLNSPRMMRPINGDFSSEVTVDGNLPLPRKQAVPITAYISGSLLLLSDDRNYIRLDRASFTRNGEVWHYANFEQRIAGKRTRMGRFNDFQLSPQAKVHLRLEVQGENVRGLVRQENEDWHEVGIAKFDNRNPRQIGLSGVKTELDEAEVTFRDLCITQPVQAVKASTSSQIDLKPPGQLSQQRPALPSHLTGIRKLQEKSLGIGDMTDAERTQLLVEAKSLIETIPPETSTQFTMVIAIGLGGSFERAGMPLMAERTYREFADTMDHVLDKSLVQSLHALADNVTSQRKAAP